MPDGDGSEKSPSTPSESFSHYSDENLKATVRNVDAELVRRYPLIENVQDDVSVKQALYVC